MGWMRKLSDTGPCSSLTYSNPSANAAAKAGMPTALAAKESVARHLRRERALAPAARGRRAPDLNVPVLDPPGLGTPVLGPSVSGASLAGVLNAGVLRLAPRPPVVVTPLPRSHGDRSCRPRRYAGPLTCRAHASP